MGLKMVVRKSGQDTCTVTLNGELSTETHELFEKRLQPLAETAQALVFDMKKLSYISSIGLSAFFRVKQAMESRGGTIALIHVQPQIQQVFDVMKVLSDRMFASLEEADDFLDKFLDGVQSGKIKPRKPLGPGEQS